MKAFFATGLVFSLCLAAPGTIPAQEGDLAYHPALPAELFAADADEVAGQLVVAPGQSKLLRAKADVARTAVDDDTVCGVLVTSPREFSIEGKRPGVTRITFWLKGDEHQPVTIAVRVAGQGQDGK